MNLELGGPGTGCSAMRVRRLVAGELSGAERERVLQHVAGCPRCTATQNEMAREQEQLRRDVPFPAFAAAVADKLAQERPRRSPLARWGPLAAAAGLALFAGALALRPADTETVRPKGGPSVQLFVKDGRGVRQLTPQVTPKMKVKNEKDGTSETNVTSFSFVPPGAQLLLSLHPAGRKQAAVVLVEQGETSVLYSGATVNGPLPQAFEWTGLGTATLLVVFGDGPLDAARLRSPKDAPRGADVVEVPLRR